MLFGGAGTQDRGTASALEEYGHPVTATVVQIGNNRKWCRASRDVWVGGWKWHLILMRKVRKDSLEKVA